MSDQPEQNVAGALALYEFATKQVDEERGRLSRVDAKANGYFTVVTVLLGGFAFIGQSVIETAMPPHGLLAWMLLVLSFAVLGILLRSFLLIFSILQVHATSHVGIDEHTIARFAAKPLSEVYLEYSKLLLEVARDNRDVTNRKVKRLKSAYHWVVLSISGLAAQFFVLCLFRCLVIDIQMRG